MFRRAPLLRCKSNSAYWQTPQFHADDRAGAFNVEAAAEKLNIDARYARGLLLEHNTRTFKGRGRMLPAEVGRTSRPGSRACTYGAMFPLYNAPKEIKFGLQRSFKRLSVQ